VLALVVCGLLVTLALPLRTFVEQRQEIGELRDGVTAAQQRVDDLETEVSRWEDPAYVQAQARERLFYVMPGETQYIVLDPAEPTEPDAGQADGAGAGGAAAGELERPWFSRLWGSVEAAAGDPEAGDPADTP
jgi:cell division protein FtsB